MLLPLSALLVIAHSVAAYNPGGGYAPTNVSCPQDASFVRAASGISESETEWLKKRHAITDVLLADFLDRADLQDFDAQDFLESLNRSINVGLAFSGGGYRAMLNGAGQISALDNRTTGADEHGLGGLLQASTYLAGLSGGNWLTGTLALNNWTSVEEIISGDTIWDLEHSIINSGGINVFSTASRWDDISDAIEEKQDAGYNTSLTDIWGRALSYQFFGKEDDGGVSLTFSGIAEFEPFINAEMPFPFSVSVGRAPHTKIINLNSTVFEFNPFELGSWDPSLFSFTDLKYMGSDVSDGVPNSDICVEGYDNGGFVLGTSSSLFNQFLLQLNTTSLTGIVYDLVHKFLTNLDEDSDDVAIYRPNPFLDTNYAALRTIVESEYLFLVDGGEDYQNIPFAPLLQPERDVDVIFAFDNSADTDDNFPNGTSLSATYERQFGSQGNGTSFPYVPSMDTIIAHNLTVKPLFLGCNASNLTELATIPPLVVYIPNIAYTTWSNTSTFKMSYDNDERDAIIQNGFEVATRYNLTIDENWHKCVACAIIHRSQERNNITQSDECAECFQEYCWNGEQYTGDEPVLDRSVNYTSSSKHEVGAEGSASVSDAHGSTSTASTSSQGGSTSHNAAASFGPSYTAGFIAVAVAPMIGLMF